MNADKVRARLPHASASFLRLNGLDGPAKAPEGPKEATIRQNRGKASKLQLAFVEYLKHGGGAVGGLVLEEAINLEVANGCRYRPDAWTIIDVGNEAVQLNAWEVKGPRAWDDSIVKLKVAARAYPWITFRLVTRPGRLGPWKIVKIEP